MAVWRFTGISELACRAAVLWLTAGVHFIQVANGSDTVATLTLTTCADYIPEQEAENPLPEPVVTALDTNVVNLFG